MGNSKLRKQANEALRRAGFGKLYTGPKRKIFRYLNARILRHIIFMASLRKGDIVNDCDGFNHRLKSNPEIARGHTGLPIFGRLEFEDGRLSCGCPYGPDIAWTNEQIRSFHSLTDNEINDLKKDGWWTEKNQRLIDRIRNGEPITDEYGIKLKDL